MKILVADFVPIFVLLPNYYDNSFQLRFRTQRVLQKFSKISWINIYSTVYNEDSLKHLPKDINY